MILARSFLAFFLVFAVLVPSGSTVWSTPAFAQTENGESPVGGAVPGGTTDGSASDSELWRMIRQGGQGNVAGGNPNSGLMIQSQGEEWRNIRNGPLPMYSAWAILGMLLLLSIFYAIRGRMKIAHGKSDRTITRFTLIERASHWLLASSFIVLALTGLNLIFGRNLLIPLLGPEAFATFTVFGKYVHDYVGFAFMVALLLVAILWIAHNIPNRHDVMWMLRGGGMIGGGHPPAKKFNAGQKIVFWLVILCGISISMSGWALLNPFSTTMFSDTFAIVNNVFGTDLPTTLAPVQEQQYQSLWHAIMAVFMIVVILAHIYIGSVGMEGALDAMTSGEVDENWAREHHSLWVEEVEETRNSPAGNAKTSPAE